tara:strand:- start:17 stop:160 length:144 start_codon:yes stop_codon:yes gene_type:complete
MTIEIILKPCLIIVIDPIKNKTSNILPFIKIKIFLLFCLTNVILGDG